MSSHWPTGFEAFVISAPKDADLLKASVWKVSKRVSLERDKLPAEWSAPGFLEVQICFVRRRDAGDHATLLPILEEEITLAKRLFEVIRRDSRIGFEASNHYLGSRS